MERLVFTIQEGPEYNHKYHYEREAQGDLTHIREGNVKMGQRPMSEDACLEDWSNVVTGPGALAATRSWKRQGTDSPLGPQLGLGDVHF